MNNRTWIVWNLWSTLAKIISTTLLTKWMRVFIVIKYIPLLFFKSCIARFRWHFQAFCVCNRIGKFGLPFFRSSPTNWSLVPNSSKSKFSSVIEISITLKFLKKLLQVLFRFSIGKRVCQQIFISAKLGTKYVKKSSVLAVSFLFWQ